MVDAATEKQAGAVLDEAALERLRRRLDAKHRREELRAELIERFLAAIEAEAAAATAAALTADFGPFVEGWNTIRYRK